MANSRSTRKKKIRSIHVVGRRWFDRTYGNTYHTAAISVNGQFVHKTPVDYGYGEMYMQNATAWLKKNGYLPGNKSYPTGGDEPLWQYCPRVGCSLVSDCADVQRKKDL